MPADPDSLRQPTAVDRPTLERVEVCEVHHGEDADLTALERRLHDTFRAGGRPVDIDLLNGAVPDQAAMAAWGAQRSIRAAVLRRLLLDPPEDADPRGIRLAGVRIVGELDLTSATLAHPLRLHRCTVTDGRGIVLAYAAIDRLEVTHCRLAGLTARRAKISQRLHLAGTSVTDDATVLQDAQVGRLDCTGAQLSGADVEGDALVADGLRVDGDLFLRGEFRAAGAIQLLGAHIGGQLDFSGAELTGADQGGRAFYGDGLRVDGGLFLRGEFRAAGAIQLLGAHIGGQLDCTGAELTGADQGGRAFYGDGLRVDGDLFLDGLRTTTGGIRLLGAHITGQLDCSRAELTGADQGGRALSGDRLRVESNLILNAGFTAAGAIRLLGAHIAGQLDCTGAQLTGTDQDGSALSAEGMEVAQAFFWRPATRVHGLVNLAYARVGLLVDDLAEEGGRWPPGGKLILTGFVYGSLGSRPGTLNQRLAWVRRQLPDYSPQPYEQLAAVYRAGGHEREARQVLIAARDDLRQHGSLTWPQRFGNRLLGVLLGHGYRPALVLRPLAAVYLAVVLLFWGAQHHGALVPARPNPPPGTTAAACTSAYPCFSSWGAAVDTVVPLVRLGQAEAWRLDASVPWGETYRYGAWVGTGLGWALTTLAALGVTGLVRKT